MPKFIRIYRNEEPKENFINRFFSSINPTADGSTSTSSFGSEPKGLQEVLFPISNFSNTINENNR